RRLEGELAEAEQVARVPTKADYGPVLRGLLEEWPLLTAEEKRALLGEVIRVIRVYKTGFRQPARVEIVPVWAPEE
ncbi:hypothetical protein ACFQ07_31470, partial [Actinomadura adrarensis]